MNEQEAIFGPLNFRQFLLAAVVVGMAFLANKTLDEEFRLITVGAIVVLGAWFVFRARGKTIPIEELERYLEMKKSELGPDAFDRYIAKKVATIVSHVYALKLRGIQPDEKLINVLQIFQKFSSVPNPPDIQDLLKL